MLFVGNGRLATKRETRSLGGIQEARGCMQEYNDVFESSVLFVCLLFLFRVVVFVVVVVVLVGFLFLRGEGDGIEQGRELIL